jgi:hypothetical protein
MGVRATAMPQDFIPAGIRRRRRQSNSPHGRQEERGHDAHQIET